MTNEELIQLITVHQDILKNMVEGAEKMMEILHFQEKRLRMLEDRQWPKKN